MKKMKHIDKIIGTSGAISNRFGCFIIVEDHYLVTYSLQTCKQIKRIDIKDILGITLNTSEDILYCFTRSSVIIIKLPNLSVINVFELILPDKFDDWEIVKCYNLEAPIILLVINLLGGKSLVTLCNVNTKELELVCVQDLGNTIFYSQDTGLQIIVDEWYQPKNNKNVIVSEKEHYVSSCMSYEMDIISTYATKMTLKRHGFLCFANHSQQMILIIECGWRKTNYVFLNSETNDVIRKMEAPDGGKPLEIYYIPKAQRLVLMYQNKTVIIKIQDCLIQIESILDTKLASSCPLYFKETQQLLVLDMCQGQWVDLQ